MTTPAEIFATSIRGATSKPTDVTDPTILTRNDANDYFTSVLQSRNVTPDQLIALASRSLDDEARILTPRYDDGVVGQSNIAPDTNPNPGPDGLRPVLPRGDDLEGRDPIISQSSRDVTPDQLEARDDADLITALLKSRAVIPKHEIEARSKIGNAFKEFFTSTLPKILKSILRRDLSLDQLVVARGGMEYLITPPNSRKVRRELE